MPTDTAAASRPPPQALLLLTVGGLQFMYLLDYMWMMPLGPLLMRSLRLDTLQLGALLSAHAWAAGLATLLAAPVIERWPRQRLLKGLTLLFALALLACALASQWATLMLARAAAGACGGLLSVVSKAWLADAVPAERQGRALGWVMSAFALASVAGVPLALLLAGAQGPARPFAALALLGGLLLAVQLALGPSPHVAGRRQTLPWCTLLAHRPHRQALALSASIMLAGFTFIPFIPSYLQLNGGLDSAALAQVYLAGGLAALLSAVLIGRGCDRWGALATFRLLALLAIPVMLGLAVLEPLARALGGPPGHIPPALAAAGVALLFVTVNGRMVAGTALVTLAAQAPRRAAFLALNAAVQSGAIGLATLLGATLISRHTDGTLRHAWQAALAASAAGALSCWLAGRLAAPGPRTLPPTESPACMR